MSGNPETSALSSLPLGQRLLSAGLLSEEQLDLALREENRLSVDLGEVLQTLGFVSQEVLTFFLAGETQAKLVNVSDSEIDPDVLQLLSYDIAKKFQVLPLKQEGMRLTIALSDTYNVIAVDTVERITGLTTDVVAATPSALAEAIEKHYAKARSINETVDEILSEGVSTLSQAKGTEAPMIRLCNQIVLHAVDHRVTDIHVEPDKKIVRIRMRVDGILHQEVLMPKSLQPALTARFKLMAGLNVTEKRVPQDGRISFSLGSRDLDLRVSTLPTHFGESIVLRVLDKSNVKLQFPALGLSPQDEKTVRSLITRPHGIILVTGPTGSGKTTTLYTALSAIDAQEKSVFTLEDPIEYQMPLVRQTQVNPEVGMTFAAGLRALLRQDPDVILVGEIRDKETADLAFRAAMTGHLVFSTLHTIDAVGAIPRLLDMGVEPFLIPSALLAVVGQRLVRCICPYCKVPLEDPTALLRSHNIDPFPEEPTQLWEGKGCDACLQSGYLGRRGIYEILVLNDQLHGPIQRGPNVPEIRLLARKAGMKSMFEDGLLKAGQGVTTIQEVMRVIGD